ncbi:MAG TPA: PilZ domain-containing protein [Nitrospiraceae bacterium]|nr:PilZ domain-containing protein [Nitrospiraceae bacterium]
MRDSNDVDGLETARHGWEWPIISNHQKHSERFALLRPILYELTAPVGHQSVHSSQGKALSVNISSGGMLLLMDQAPDIEQVLKVHVPTPITLTDTPTLAEVRWTRKVPFSRTKEGESYFVGLKFLF